jgi:Holliday junction resolvasome RuvABC endonuclease subunit
MTALEDFRLPGYDSVPAPPKGRRKAVWAPLTAARLGVGSVLAFDQSMRNTGWAVVDNDGRRCQVLAAGMCRTRLGEGAGNWADTFADVVLLCTQIRAVLDRYATTVTAIAHEAPPTGGGRLRRPESAILAGAVVRICCADLGLVPVMPANQSAKWLLTGRRTNVTKGQVGAALNELDWLEGRELLTNEHKRDAAAVGLAWLERLGRAA